MFDPFKQAKLQKAYQSMKEYKPTPKKDMTLEELKRLSSTGKIIDQLKTPDYDESSKKTEFMRKNNIRPGDKEWIKLWFAKPDITGENPFG